MTERREFSATAQAILPILGVGSLIVAWQFLLPLAGVPSYIVPTPSAIFAVFATSGPQLLGNFWPTAIEALAGFTIGISRRSFSRSSSSTAASCKPPISPSSCSSIRFRSSPCRRSSF